ncbi:MAG: lipoyl(octanoyl) transferase LipB [Planctomycetota bacterium]
MRLYGMRKFQAQKDLHRPETGRSFSVQFHLLGRVPFDEFLAFQRRLVYEASGQDDGRITVLLCEHPALITVGRTGSRRHIRLTSRQLRERRLEVRWVSRGGGCILHGPGQISVYPIVPLRWHGWTVGEYLRRLRWALIQTMDQLAVRHEIKGRPAGIWGRSGQLAAWGVAVRNWVTSHGAYVNVNPVMTQYPFVDVIDPDGTERGEKSTMGCLLAERRQAVTSPGVRARLIPLLAAALGTEQYHLITGHWLLGRRSSEESRHYAAAGQP